MKRAAEPSEVPATHAAQVDAVGCGEERIGVRSVSRGSETSGHHSDTAFIRIPSSGVTALVGEGRVVNLAAAPNKSRFCALPCGRSTKRTSRDEVIRWCSEDGGPPPRCFAGMPNPWCRIAAA
jgi:hypothetical protein